MGILIKGLFRKGKAGIVIVTVFILLAVFLMTIGLSVMMQYKDFYPDKIAETGSYDVVLSYFDGRGQINESVSTSEFMSEFRDRTSNLDYIEAKRVKKTLYPNSDAVKFEGPAAGDNNLGFSKLSEFAGTITNKFDGGEGIPIYLGSWLRINKGVKSGDKYEYELNGVKLNMYVAGFYEDVLRVYYGFQYILVNDADYDVILETGGGRCKEEYETEMKLADFDRQRFNTFLNDVSALWSGLVDELGLDASMMSGCGYGYQTVYTSIDATEPYILLISALMIVFALLMTVISIVIMVFGIKVGIEDDMRNLGISKSLGYTTSQLRLAYFGLYGIAVAAGAVLGIVAAVATIPLFARIITIMANMNMSLPVNVGALFIALLSVPAISLACVYLASGKLKRITPLQAIRGGISSHSFKKNRVPLEKSKVSLNVTLAVKSVFNSVAHSTTMLVVVGVLAFVCALAGVFYYNMNVDTQAMLDLSGQPGGDYDIGFYNHKVNHDDFFEKAASVDGVERLETSYNYGIAGTINDEYNVVLAAAEDFEACGLSSIYEGRYPKFKNEIALSGVLAKNIGKTVGDTVMMEIVGEKSEELLVTGLTQELNGATKVYLTYEAMVYVSGNPLYGPPRSNRLVFVEEGADRNAVREALALLAREMYPDDVFATIDYKQVVEESVFSVVRSASSLFLGIVFVITAVLTSAVIYMIVRMKMLHEKKNIAINKALGYSSFNIMNQIGLSMLSVSFAASLVGAFLGTALAPPLIAAAGKLMGLMKLEFTANYLYPLLVTALLSILTYGISLLAALATRRVTPRMLISE